MTSRLPGFYTLPVEERLRLIASLCDLTPDEAHALLPGQGLSLDQADKMIENALGVFVIPFGIATNFLVNGESHFVPMVVEEPSIVASASNTAKIVRKAGGFTATSTGRQMVGQVQVVHCSDWESARQRLLQKKGELLARANEARPTMTARGGGALDLDVKVLNGNGDRGWLPMLVVQVTIDTRDAMGANVIDTMMEAIAPDVEAITGGTVYLRILSNYTDTCLAQAQCTIPAELLGTKTLDGVEVRDRIIAAYAFAELDIYRAVTHNKGIMNGIDAVAVATGNDWRALEAAAHAYAARGGRYRSMTEWEIGEHGELVGRLELPMPVATVGGATSVNPVAKTALKLLNVTHAAQLAEIMVSVGLAQNLAALRALVTEGIQRGHMALHARARQAISSPVKQ
ncbi:hydroxymethylglutaryl-CoA reductase, degradative [Sulfobacillus harzensis]|uniref:3-hydroxy-3-methylglutaryl coenzyme A reductase n=1 Tax=Sulfobacillus harzensis TaxID=2729629 RepID=A0A7Y0L5N7_9FIRM|nr:hydroxymethylglutaryl-CoA reductase, degradative [Sulfobacillus harzensis]NMP23680.1 hydroxymethylglutaryl-CoA reductase, degradative [Sulfobacillus harzensis]